ncbi:MAG: dihydrofolate reductase family protein [Bacteroidota bacterium]
MRKLIVQEWLSADGFAADENGSTDFFGPSEENEPADNEILAYMESIDTIILGANTYRMFLDFWPTEKSAKEIMADKINETTKLVFSNSLNKVEWGKWDNAELQKGDAIEIIKNLKTQNGKDLILWGSLSLFRSLLNAKLVDVLEIRTVPIILGKGLRFFGKGEPIKMESKKVKKYGNGFTLTEYLLKY